MFAQSRGIQRTHGQKQNMILKYCVFTVVRKMTKNNRNRPTYKLTVCSSSMFKLISSHYLHLCLSLSRLKMDYMIPSWVNTDERSMLWGCYSVESISSCNWSCGLLRRCWITLSQRTSNEPGLSPAAATNDMWLSSGAWLTARRKQDATRRCSDHLNTICVFM